MQFDLFHIYTVDAHTLQVVRNMRRFRYRDQAQKFPVAAHIYRDSQKWSYCLSPGYITMLPRVWAETTFAAWHRHQRRFCERHNLAGTPI